MDNTQKAKTLLQGAYFFNCWDDGPLYRAFAGYSPGDGIVCREVVFREDENNASLVLEQKAMDTVDNMIADRTVDPCVMRLLDIWEEMVVDFDNDLETLDSFICSFVFGE